MFDRILVSARALVRDAKYYMTTHGQAAMYDDELTLVEVENVIVTGGILERQRDDRSGEFKYRIRAALAGGDVEAVFKFAPDGRLAIITVYCI